jgi:hypothetical protein
VQDLELQVELSKSEVDRHAGEFAVGDLGIGPAATTVLGLTRVADRGFGAEMLLNLKTAKAWASKLPASPSACC